jgi:hypothetical protein
MFVMPAISQTVVTNEKSKTVQVKDRLISYQMGTATTQNGSYTVLFDAPLEVDYTVMLTPYDASAELYIAEKTKNQLVIKSKNTGDHTFDFVIFIKRPVPQAPAGN